MNRNRKGNSCIKIFILLLCLCLCGLFVWGILSLSACLADYGRGASIGNTDDENGPQDGISAVDPADLLPKNNYEAECFFEENGWKNYQSDSVGGMVGIDVSSHQGEIDWKMVKEAGVDFAIIRLGYRGYVSGILDLDEWFHRNMEEASKAGLSLGVYFFSQALNEEEAVEEAEYVLEHLEGYELQFPVIFDWEEVQAEARTDEMNMVLLTGCAKAFCERIEKAGYRAGIYFNQEYGYMQMNLQSLKDYTFWLAEYNQLPTFYYDFQIWQYTNEGTVPGINEKVDLNIAFVPQS